MMTNSPPGAEPIMPPDGDPRTAPQSNANSIGGLRADLFATLRAVKAGTLELDKARTINEIGKTLIDSARVEVEHLKATGSTGESHFIAPAAGDDDALPNGITTITRHRLRG